MGFGEIIAVGVSVPPYGHVISSKMLVAPVPNDGGYEISGLAYGNGHLWILTCGASPYKVYELDPDTFEVLNSWTVPFYPRGLTYLNATTLVVGDYLNDTIRLLNPDTGVESSNFSIGDRPQGIANDGTDLFVSMDAGEIRKYSVAGVLLDSFGNPKDWLIFGLTYSSPYLYGVIFGQGDEDNHLLELDPVTREINRMHPVPSAMSYHVGLTFDGKYFRIAQLGYYGQQPASISKVSIG